MPTMENAIKEHKSGFGLEKLPTQKFHANWAYLLIGQLAFNLLAWFKRLGVTAQRIIRPRSRRFAITC